MWLRFRFRDRSKSGLAKYSEGPVTAICDEGKHLKISDIRAENYSSWAESFLTFDLDWCHDEILAHTLEILDSYEVDTTWFITHETSHLEAMRSNLKIELGVHPNFLPLLNSDPLSISAEETINQLVRLVPEARVVRSHSLVSSSRLTELLAKRGMTHESGVFIPAGSANAIAPWNHPSGLVQVPFGWADDVALYTNQPEPEALCVQQGSLSVFDFHPIHVFLNTESMDRYESTRPLHQKPGELAALRFEGYGTRDRLINLLRTMSPP